MNLVLRTTAMAVRNKGGGIFRGQRVKGADYVTFMCPNPKCNHRNKIAVDRSESYVPSDSAALAFKCKMCRTVIEVFPPTEKKESLIMSPEAFAAEMAARRRELAVNRTKLGRA